MNFPSLLKAVSRLALITAILGSAAIEAPAHGGDFPKASHGHLEAIPEPIEGAREFAMTLSGIANGLLTEAQLKQLNQVLRHYHFASDIRNGHYPEASPRDAAFNRFQAEQILCQLLAEVPQVQWFRFGPKGTLPDPHSIIPFDAQAGFILIGAQTGNEVRRFEIQEFGMHQERYDGHYEIPVDPDGITYILQKISQPPPGKSSTHIAFRMTDQTNPFYWHALTLDVPQTGQLQMRIVDEAGNPVPAMARLTALPSGRLWSPASAFDFHPMLNEVTGSSIDALPGLNIYGPDGGFEVRMPGEFAGHYWVVSGPFEMDLPAGRWKITVFRGIETVPVSETFEIRSNHWTRKTIQLSRWTEMASRGWYSGDDHVHSRLRSSEDGEKLMAFTRAMDIRVANILEMGDPQRTYYIQRGFGKDFRMEKEGHFLVPGQEDPRSILGHNIGLNLKHLARDLDRYLLLDWVAHNIHQQGGLFGQTHVGQNSCLVHRGMALMAPWELYDFYSIMQGSLGTELYYDFLDLGYKLTASAGSDMPYGGTLGNVRLYAFIGEEEAFTPDAWFDALKKGRTFVTNGPMLEFSINDALPGDELVIEDPESLTVEATARGLPGHSAPVRLEIVKLSEVIRSATSEGTSEGQLSISTSISIEESCWIAARAYGEDGSAAHTTPIYISKPGERHWNPDRARGIIERQLSILDEIEGVLSAAEAAKQDGTMLNVDYWAIRSVDQAEPLRERLQRTRGLYDKLLRELEEAR